MDAVDYVWRCHQSVLRLSRRLDEAPPGCDPRHVRRLDRLLAEERAKLEIVTQAAILLAAERGEMASDDRAEAEGGPSDLPAGRGPPAGVTDLLEAARRWVDRAVGDRPDAAIIGPLADGRPCGPSPSSPGLPPSTASNVRWRTGPLIVEVGRTPSGWAWEVIDEAGFVFMAGHSAQQEQAMTLAWRAARSWRAAPGAAFPDARARSPADFEAGQAPA